MSTPPSELNLRKTKDIARALSIAENRSEQLPELMERIYSYTGHAHVLGVTGSPGAGKSSLVNSLIKKMRERDVKVGVIAVDPSSPFTGGAILGDRVRMQDHSVDKGVFIRSMASRGSLGGVSISTREAISILDAAGFDLIIIETVGVGQSEIDVVKIADTVSLVLTPNSGDSIQTLKAGIMEIGSMFVINKYDLPGSSKIYQEIESMLDFNYHNSDNRPEIISTSAVSGQGIDEFVDSIQNHKKLLLDTDKWTDLRYQRAKEHVTDLVRHELGKKIEQSIEQHDNEVGLMNEVFEHRMSPHKASARLLDDLLE